MATTYNFPTHESGDTFNGVQFELKVNSVAKDLSGAIITMNIAGKKYTSTAGNFVISDALNGKFNFKKQKVTLPSGYHQYEITIEFEDGDIKTYVTGYWTITDLR
jgi:hypothetical protein